MTRLVRVVRDRWLVLLLVVLLGYLVIYPLVVVVARSLEAKDEGGDGGVAAYQRVFESRSIGEITWNTGVVVLLAVTIAMFLGSTIAWLIERTDLPGKRLLAHAPMVPVFVSPLVIAIGYMFLFEPAVGFVNVALRGVVGSDAAEGPLDINSIVGIGVVTGLYATSYVYPLVRAAAMAMDGTLEEAARVSNASMLRTLRHVTLPLLRPALLAAALFAFVVSVAEYSIPTVLGSRANIDVASTEIVRYVRAFPADRPAGAALSVLVMMITALGIIPVHRALNRGQRYEVIGRGAQTVTPLGRWRWPLFGYVAGFVTITSILPLAAILLVALLPFWTADISWGDLTTANLRGIMDEEQTWDAVANSIRYSVLAATLAVALGFAVAYCRRFLRSRIASAVDFLATLPIAVPSVVLGVGFLFLSLRGPIKLYGTAAALVIAYVTKFCPLALRTLGASFAQIRGELVEASRVHGASAARSVRHVLAPLSAPGIRAAWALMLIVMLREFPMSALLSQRQTAVMSVHLYNLLENGLYGRVAAFSLVVFGVGVAVVAAAFGASLLLRLGGRSVRSLRAADG